VSLFDVALPHPEGFRETDVLTLSRHERGTVRVIDVREPSEFTGELGHIPGAELVALSEIPTRCSAWDREAVVVLVCRSGKRSAAAAQVLVKNGFKHVVNLVGGTQAHAAAGLPVER